MEELPDLSKLSHAEKDALIVALWRLVQALRVEVKELQGELAELKGRLKKDSHNSSKPPSSDGLKKTQSQRRPSGRKPGGQSGHPRQHATADE